MVNTTGSDSSSMDNMLELMLLGGMDLFRACRTMIPPAWHNVEHMDAELKAFYEFNSMHMEPWDGPAGIVLTDGRYAVCLLDRNGLRPARWVITKNGYITLASEVGTFQYKPEDVVAKGRVGPGRILAIDTLTGEFLETDTIDNRLKKAAPYKDWLKANAVRLRSRFELAEEGDGSSMNPDEVQAYQKLFQVSYEERDQVIRPLAETGQEAVGSKIFRANPPWCGKQATALTNGSFSQACSSAFLHLGLPWGKFQACFRIQLQHPRIRRVGLVVEES